MTVTGYTDRRARLAFRSAQRPELAMNVLDYFEHTSGQAEGRQRLAAISYRTSRLIDWWEKLAIISLAQCMADVAAVSQEQLACFTAIFRGAGIDLNESDVPEPSDVEFAWSSVAHAAVLASFDVLADSDETTLSAGDWAGQCLEHLDAERFRRATGIDPRDHAKVLRITTNAIISGGPGKEEIGYRDRWFNVRWTGDGITASSNVRAHVLQGAAAGAYL